MTRMRLKSIKALLGLKMSNKIRSILSDIEKQKFATSTGKQTHAILQYYSGSNTKNLDNELYKKFSTNKELDKFFCADSKAEVPVAGYINGRFVSRRIDRLATNHDDKTVYILDYKTDSDKNVFHDKYVAQIKEYKTLLHDIYPEYKIHGFILWINDFTLEEIA